MLPHCGLDGKHVSAINGFKIGDVTLVPSAAGGAKRTAEAAANDHSFGCGTA